MNARVKRGESRNKGFEGTSQCIKAWCHRFGARIDKNISVSDTTALQFSNLGERDLELGSLVDSLYNAIERDWQAAGCRPGGALNWCWRFRVNIENDTSMLRPEVKLERHLANMLETENAGDRWANQTPTASGLLHSRSRRTSNLDLANWDAGILTLIELKAKTSNPIAAAFQLVCYSLHLRLARVNAHRISIEDPRWENAPTRLKVLAPMKFYERYRLEWFAKQLSSALETFGFLGFSFHAFPNLPWRPSSEGELFACLNGPDGEPHWKT